ncbi:VOC family protein [Mesorhizobium loti]|uniref:VOC family protein n=1 Tax=Rhizobium loti TaxID=381 RepID=UPI0004101311|nr:glyoxalase/bleomycin resistance/extradiol dioxygenase family protein [Mesorhizobium loti]
MTDNQEPTRVVPYLSLAGRAREAIEVWGRAFGAEEIMAVEENGHLRHAEVRINGGPVFLTDFSMEPIPAFQPTPSIALHLEVPDGSDWMARGKAAGCRVLTPWQNMAFGGFGRLVDCFGVIWSIASPKPGY